MKKDEVVTLEDLRMFFAQEAKKINPYDDSQVKYLDSILDGYELSSDDKIYITQYIFSMEEQSNQKTLINAKKAATILLRKRGK